MSEERIKQVHFIGVGGVGMSGIARVAHDQGMQVSGSDIKESRYTKQLREAGITVFIGQKAENVPEGDPVVVISTAILENNPELIEARRRGLEHLASRPDARASRRGPGHARRGRHARQDHHVVHARQRARRARRDPTFLIGGIVRAYGTNAHSGTGARYVVEADESDKSFTYLSPKAVLVTNIEADHLDHYKDLDEIYDKFHDFMGLVPEDGVIVACGEEPHVVEIARSEGRRMHTYGFNEGCDVRIISYEPHGIGSRYAAVMPDGTQVEGAIKQNPGRHNVLNATGVIALLWALGFDAAKVAQALSGFAGVRRRFDLVGEVGGVTVVDDYAHHPTEIAATISAAAGLRLQARPRAFPAASLFPCAPVHPGAPRRVRRRLRQGR